MTETATEYEEIMATGTLWERARAYAEKKAAEEDEDARHRERQARETYRKLLAARIRSAVGVDVAETDIQPVDGWYEAVQVDGLLLSLDRQCDDYGHEYGAIYARVVALFRCAECGRPAALPIHNLTDAAQAYNMGGNTSSVLPYHHCGEWEGDRNYKPRTSTRTEEPQPRVCTDAEAALLSALDALAAERGWDVAEA